MERDAQPEKPWVQLLVGASQAQLLLLYEG